MTFEPLSSDFYGFEAALTNREKDAVMELRAFLEAEVRPIANDLWARAEFFPRSVVEGLARIGLFGQPWEETKRFENSAVFRGWCALELARVDASAAALVGMQNDLVMGSIATAGSKQQREEWLPRLASGELLGAFGLTEPLSGSDSAQGLRTAARRGGDNWILNGAKRWIGNGSISDVTIVWAKDAADGQVKGFIVPTGTPGYSASRIENKQALRIVQNADITLTDAVVPESNRLQGRTRSATPPSCCASPAPRSPGARSGTRSARMRPRSPTRESASSSARRSAATNSCRSCSRRASATSPPRSGS